MYLSELAAKAESSLDRAIDEGLIDRCCRRLSPIDLLECALDFWMEEKGKQMASDKKRMLLLTRSLLDKSENRNALRLP